MKKGTGNDITQTITINENISAPINKGDVLGKVTYSCPDGSVAEVNLVAEKDVEKIGIWNMTSYLYKLWFGLFRNVA